MLNDGTGFKRIYLATGYTDLRRGIEGLAAIIRFQFELDPYDRNTLFLFCGRRCDRIKALLWEGLSEYSDKKKMVSVSIINVWIMGGSNGHGILRK